MRSYLIDEISPADMEKIEGYLEQNAIKSNLEKIFWVQMSENLLSDTQFQHRDCQPYAFAIELGPDWVKLEFLVRNLKNLHCICNAFCTLQQRDFILNFAHKMMEHQDIRT